MASLDAFFHQRHHSPSATVHPDNGASGNCMFHAFETLAYEDTLRTTLSSMRILFVMGEKDAGKTTFLSKVFKIEGLSTGYLEEERTDETTFYQHPKFNQEFCPVYVADTPGIRDAVGHRNDSVRLLSTCAVSLPNVSCVAWLTTAKRPDEKPSADDHMFALLARAGIIRFVVITHVDDRVKQMWDAELVKLEKIEQDDIFDQEATKKQQEIMQTIKNDLLVSLKQLYSFDPKLIPIVVYACLSEQSWAYTGERIGRRRRDPPKAPDLWEGAKKDITEFFNILDAEKLQGLIDGVMGVI